MIGVINTNLSPDINYNDDSVFYFETQLFYQTFQQIDGQTVFKSGIQSHPCVPCNKNLFVLDNLPDYIDENFLSTLYCIDYEKFQKNKLELFYRDD